MHLQLIIYLFFPLKEMKEWRYETNILICAVKSRPWLFLTKQIRQWTALNCKRKCKILLPASRPTREIGCEYPWAKRKIPFLEENRMAEARLKLKHEALLFLCEATHTSLPSWSQHWFSQFKPRFTVGRNNCRTQIKLLTGKDRSWAHAQRDLHVLVRI